MSRTHTLKENEVKALPLTALALAVLRSHAFESTAFRGVCDGIHECMLT